MKRLLLSMATLLVGLNFAATAGAVPAGDMPAAVSEMETGHDPSKPVQAPAKKPKHHKKSKKSMKKPAQPTPSDQGSSSTAPAPASK
ncbi:hypothetical protein GMLC_09250 [Geomonas limicola]|uniref:Pentapeptide MXKDX repeat protein n=1 Tax=Geomonas limicola TaxID=2740186 RepID=A0A6V8N4A1_9BACT|nr:hypothetical protein [Geomonas limicola]GFO67346.1 hypothetical protein GMLC_09250 [Geomonas limicola]